MNVTWQKRAQQQYQSRNRLARVQARLDGRQIGDITIGVPIITAKQLRAVDQLRQDLDALVDRFTAITTELSAALALMRPQNHPEGWTNVEIVEYHPSDRLVVADIRQQKVPSKTTATKQARVTERRRKKQAERLRLNQIHRPWLRT